MLVILMFVACSGNTSTNNNNMADNTINNDDNSAQFRIVEIVIIDNSGKQVTAYTYNDNNQMLEKKITHNGNFVNNIVYEYNEENQLVKKTNTYKEEVPVITTYTYDDEGYKIKEEWSKEDGGNGIKNYEYDEHGNLIMFEEINYTEDIIDDEYYKSEKTYDEKNRLIKEESLESHGLIVNTEYIYKNDLLMEIKHTQHGWETSEKYEYNKNGDVIKINYTDSDGTYSKEFLTYNDKHQLIEKYFEISGKDKSIFYMEVTEKYHYDDKGNLIKKEIHNITKSTMLGDKEENTIELYKYDEYNNLIETVITVNGGNRKTTTYKYESY